MTDHHDFSYDDHHFADHSYDDHPLDPAPLADDHLTWEDPGHDFDSPGHDADVPHEAAGHELPGSGHDAPGHASEFGHASELGHEAPGLGGHEGLEPGAGHDDLADSHISDISDSPEVFPPVVDVGELPEPVDGFPWIDTQTLGPAGPGAVLPGHDTTDPVRPEELAEYAGAELPPGADPWAALADSDDPATAALARWWQQN